jgi:hypothetical protein
MARPLAPLVDAYEAATESVPHPSSSRSAVKPEGSARGRSLVVHPLEHRDANVDAVVELDVVLAYTGA